MRSKRALRNTITSFANEIISVICGLILPRCILIYFGSEYNGLTSSISQFLSCASLLVAGVGGVTRAALYKPLAEGNKEEISAIVNATDKFMKRVAIILAVGIVGFSCVYPFFVIDEFEWLFSFSLFLILGINTFLQYFFCATYQILLQSDQRHYVISSIHIVTTILNTILAIALLKLGFGIHVVKLGSAIAFSFSPLLISLFVKKNYEIDKTVAPNSIAINQRWDAFWQAIANFVHNNTDIIILSLFSNMSEVSVYTVYNYIISNIRMIITNSITGFGAAFGNMLAKGETELAKRNLRVYELVIFSLTSIVYTTAGIMIVPFALLYTKNVMDVNYSRPVFAILVTIAGAFSCFRIPYQTIVEAAGHFKRTRNGAIVEAVLNIGISLILVSKYGLIGVAIGTVVATIFRSFQYALYLSKNIIKRSIWIFVTRVILTFIVCGCTLACEHFLISFTASSILLWIVKAVIIVLIASVFTVAVNVLFYRNDLLYLISKAKNIQKKH